MDEISYLLLLFLWIWSFEGFFAGLCGRPAPSLIKKINFLWIYFLGFCF